MYKFLIFLLIIPVILILNIYNIFGIDENYQIINGEKLLLEKSIFKDIKINNKFILLDLSTDIRFYKKDSDTTNDILNTGKFIYKKEDIDKYLQYYNYFYGFLIENLKNGFKKNELNIEILFDNNESTDQTSNHKILLVEIQDYYEGQYNLIKNESTKFKISVKLYRKDLINSYIVLFIKNYKSKSTIIYVNEKVRIEKIANLCSNSIIKEIKNRFLIK